MKSTAITFPEVHKVSIEQLELPSLGPADVLLKTELSGVSVGTERWAYSGQRAEIRFPNVPGYMGVGTILEAGRDALQQGYTPGRRINFAKSRLPEPLESNSWMGTHLGHSIIRTNAGDTRGEFYHHQLLPNGCTPDDAVLAALAAVPLRGIEMASIPAGATVLIVGLGVIGQYAAQICRLKGAHTIVTDPVESRRSIALSLGAIAAAPSEPEALQAVAAEHAPDGFDIIVDTSSKPAVVNSLFPLLKLHGRMILQGWYPPPSPLDLNAAHMRMATLYTPCSFCPTHVETVIDWGRKGWLKTAELITHRVPPAQALSIYSMIDQGSDAFLGILFDWSNSN